jgi:hypothetical protein
MIQCWEKLKDVSKWRIGYTAYHEAVKNGTATLVVDGEDDDHGQKARPPCPRAIRLARPILPGKHLPLR